jgi:II/X family phage/plasmid replication protein
MIDKLVLRAFFQYPENVDIRALGIPLQAEIDAAGEVYDLRHPWESIPSSFSNLAFHFWRFDPDRKNPDPFIEIKASPAKLLQGHNVFGSDDLFDCACVLWEVFYLAYPELALRLDQSSWELVECDVTYASWAASDNEARQFIRALTNISNGQTRPSNSSFDGTAYFGKKNSRIKKIKVYHKLMEILAFLSKHRKGKKDYSVYYTKKLLDWCVGMIRWEATLKSRWFERRGIPTKMLDLVKVFDAQKYWTESTADLLKALEGESMAIVNDEEVLIKLKELFPTVSKRTGKTSYDKAMGAYRTYLAIKQNGYIHTKELMSKTGFYRQVDMICGCGLSKAQLQNMDGNHGAQVIPLVQYAAVEFRRQFPDWYEPPKPDQVSHLKL